MRELYSSPFFVLRIDEARRIVTRARTERRFASLEEVEAEYGSMLPVFDQVSRARFGLLVDMRLAPPRNDPAFERIVNRLYHRLYGGFREVAILVKTQAGKLQLTRVCEVNGIKAGIFLDEAAAFAHLELDHTTGERLRTGTIPPTSSSLPPTSSSNPARRVSRA